MILSTGSLALMALAPFLATAVRAGEEERRPRDFAVVFTFGYSDDGMPQEPERFEALMKQVAAANFNTVLCNYSELKHRIIKKHGLKMMVNLLWGDHHVYKNPEGAEKLARSLAGDQSIWGYHLFSDTNSKTAAGRDRDISNVHGWDPTHPTFVGFHRTSGMSRLKNPDVLAYYDFHWNRGPEQNFPHLLAYARQSKARDAFFYRWLRVPPNTIRASGTYLRSKYTAFTSIACGLKGILWFIGQDYMDRRSWPWKFNPHGLEIVKINATLAALGPELMKLSHEGVVSTETTKTLKDRDKGNEPPVPGGLPPIPEDHWFRFESGEAVVGMFRDGEGRDALFIANHNTYAPHDVALRFASGVTSVERFDRKARRWRSVEPGPVRFKLDAAEGELIRLRRRQGKR